MNNKFTTYLLYAIGEIILVVVGILIAVSIDDWNEQRNDLQMGNYYLHKLESSLAADIISYDKRIDNLYEAHEHLKQLETELYDSSVKKLSESPTMTLMGTFGLRLESATWENLKSSGKIDLIDHEDLLDSIFKYYNFYEDVVIGWNETNKTYSNEIIAPFLIAFDDIQYSFEFLPYTGGKPIAEYRQSTEFRNIVNYRKLAIPTMITILENQKNRALRIKEMISKKIKNS